MAQITIIPSDDPDGSVNVSLRSEPRIPGRDHIDEMTEAKASALLMLDAVATPDDITRRS